MKHQEKQDSRRTGGRRDEKFEGMKWGDLTEQEKAEMLRNANAIDGRDCSDVSEGEAIIDLIYPHSVPGEVRDGEIIIKDDAVIYNCEG